MQPIKSLATLHGSKLSFVISLILLVVFVSVLVYLQKHYQIRQVKVSGYSKYAPEVRGLDIFDNKNIFHISDAPIKEFILKANPYIKDLEIRKKYPDTVELKISYYTPLIYLQVKDGFFLLGDKGIILEKHRERKNHAVPLMKYYQDIPYANLQAGQALTFKDVRDSIVFFNVLRSEKISINSIDIVSFHMLGLYTDDQKYFFSSEKDADKQKYQLEQALGQFKRSGQKYKTMDFRFDKVVVTF